MRSRSPTWWSPWAAVTPAPTAPAHRYEDWELEDPAGKDLDTVRRIRDDIKRRVQALLADLLPATV